MPHKKIAPPAPDSLWQNPWHFIAFGFGSGAMPWAPGTFGTLLAIPFYLLVASWPFWPYFFLIVLLGIGAAILSDKVSREIDFHDHPGMNIDEFIGFGVSMMTAGQGFSWIFWGFVLFRFFDILKPFPIGWIDRHIKNGWGMILDDVAAGIATAGILGIFRLL